MSERGQRILEYAPIGLLGILIAIAILIAAGPSRGGAFRDIHRALRDLWTGEDRAVSDNLAPASTSGARVIPSIPRPATVPTAPLTITLPSAPQPIPSAPCAAFSFGGSISIQRGRVSFGRLNLVTRTDPHGTRDPLASWKLVLFDGFSVDMADISAGRSITIPVGQTVNMLISDPFTGEMLFSARWRVDEIEVHRHSASINARLATNLSDIRVNNTIESETLATFAAGGTDALHPMGVLVMAFEHTEDIAQVLRKGEPLYTSMRGIVHLERCIR